MIRLILIAFITYTSSLFATGAPLTIGVESFSPPFVMQGANKEIYGFDIDMMNSLCKILNRTCNYKIMRFDRLLDAVVTNKIDLAVSSITITPERSKLVNFSLPYLLSYSRFLQRQASVDEPFSLNWLSSKKIGLESGTVYVQQLDAMGVKNPDIEEFSSVANQLSGLSDKSVDIILLDNPTAIYWASNSSDSFKLAGPPYMYGYGYGIAINPTNSELLSNINRALVQYQNSDEFKQNYNRYLQVF